MKRDEQLFSAQIDHIVDGHPNSNGDALLDFAAQLAKSSPHADPAFQRQLEARLLMQMNGGKKVVVKPKRRRIHLIAAIVILMLLFAAVAYAVDSILRRVIYFDPGLRAVDEAQQGIELNLSQTIEGYTVEVQWAHADANRVSVGFTVSTDDDVEYTNLSPLHLVLTDDSGNTFPLSGGFGSGTENNVGGNVYSFDLSVLDEVPETLNLRLEMDIEVVTALRRTQMPTPDWDAWAEGPYGPFVFEFSLPTSPSRVYAEPQTVQASGIDVTLREFVITESQTQAVVCFEIPDPAYHDWSPIVFLRLNGENPIGEDVAGGSSKRDEEGCYRTFYNTSLYHLQGEWTVEVSELVGMKTQLTDEEWAAMREAGEVHQSGGMTGVTLPEGGLEALSIQRRIAGPWTFTFTIP